MYTLREVTDEEKKVIQGVDVMCGESRAAGFKGGLSLMITTTHAALPSTQAQQAFLHGIVLAMSHCSITGSVPSVVDR